MMAQTAELQLGWLTPSRVSYEGPDLLDVVPPQACAVCSADGPTHLACAMRAAIHRATIAPSPTPPDLDAPNFLGHYPNMFGNPSSYFVCGECHMPFSLHPALWPGETVDEFCLSEDCPSYRIDRDPLAMQYLGDAGPLIGKDIA